MSFVVNLLSNDATCTACIIGQVLLAGADLRFIKGGGALISWVEVCFSMQSMLELGESGGMPPTFPRKIDVKILQFGDILHISACRYFIHCL